MERTNKSEIKELKIKCAYLAPEDGSMVAGGIPEENEDLTGVNGDQSRMMDESVRVVSLAFQFD